MSRLSDLCDRAGVTEKEMDALRLYDPGVVGYRSVGLALGVAPETARDRIKRAMRKIAAQEDVEL